MVNEKLISNENPLADYGSIISGDRFIGRENEINNIKNRVLGRNFGNISIVGLPRIGKSSLVWQALMVDKENLLREKKVVIRINVGEINSTESFFNYLIDEVYFEIEGLIDDNQKIRRIYDKLNNVNLKKIEKRKYLQRFFKTINREQLRIIFILDEFDHIKIFFKLEDFQLLRELSINPETKIALITISRLTIQELELENGTISTLAGVFSNLYLGMFSDIELDEYWKYLAINHFNPDNDYKELLANYSGNYPFLIDLLNYEVIANKSSKKQKFTPLIISKLKLNLFNNYDNIINLLKKENLLDKLFQLLIGPIYDLCQKDIERLVKYALIKKENTIYKSFSSFFREYLKLKNNEITIWPLWSETENELRKIVKYYLSNQFGEEWIDSYLKQNQKKKKEIERFISMKTKNIKSFGDRASNNLVDYTYPLDLFDCFISTDWNYFKNIFGLTKKEWKPDFLHLAKIRNPIAHNNSYFISDDDKNLAKGICKKILEKISIYNNSI